VVDRYKRTPRIKVDHTKNEVGREGQEEGIKRNRWSAKGRDEKNLLEMKGRTLPPDAAREDTDCGDEIIAVQTPEKPQNGADPGDSENRNLLCLERGKLFIPKKKKRKEEAMIRWGDQ
jgi:hypothetical protein